MSSPYHEKGNSIRFTAVRPAILRGRRYAADEIITIVLTRDWREDEGIGEGGPWGWGGYTSRFVASLGEVER